jgi:hypothetical protein
LVVTIYTAIVSIDLAIVFKVMQGDLLGKVGFILQLIGIYGIALGFISGTKLAALARFEYMTSGNLFEFMAESFGLLSFITGAVSSVRRAPVNYESPLASSIGLVVTWACLPLFWGIIALYVFAVMPLAYVGFAIANALVQRMSDANDVVSRRMSERTGEVLAEVSIRVLLEENRVAIKSFLVGMPAILLGLVSDMLVPLLHS